MSSSTSLVPVRATELILGKPAPWPIYNDAGELLLARGTVIETAGQLEGLVRDGLYRNSNWVSEPDTESVPLPQARDVLQKRAAAGRRHLKPSGAVRGSESVVALQDVRWRIGDTLWLQMKEDANLRYSVNLIGCLAGKSLLVSAPVKDGKYVFMREGQSFVVRALTGKRAYAFSAQLLKHQQTPYVYMHLTCPKEVRSTVIRQDTRVDVSQEGYLALGSAEPLPAVLLDLSINGASVLAPPLPGKLQVQKGGTGQLRLVAPVADESLRLDLPFVLRTVEADSDPQLQKYGIEFAGLTARDRLILSAYIYQAMSEQE
ncbi:flagellar brake protein [Herbaspirillum lusitanum]|jgi:c-di-GMP-binding flagellar brake protein YcgR|uniref:Flagellar brake protein n=1 Tax=Herbaspirillum lusitanum TaxID=213312 RepID=A0ABW9A473_9BURK